MFRCPPQISPSKAKQMVLSLNSDCALFSRLYIACQIREGDLENFFRYENHAYPLALPLLGKLRLRNKADPQRFRHQNHGVGERRQTKDGNRCGHHFQKLQYPVQSFLDGVARKDAEDTASAWGQIWNARSFVVDMATVNTMTKFNYHTSAKMWS
jgi:hypothetical protein